MDKEQINKINEKEYDTKLDELRAEYTGILFGKDDPDFSKETLLTKNHGEILDLLRDRAVSIYTSKEEKYGADWMRNVERNVLLRTVDRHWMEHLDAMDDLRDSIHLEAYAQRNPISEYRIAGMNLFDHMTDEIRRDTSRTILTAIPREELERRRQIMVVKNAVSGTNGPISTGEKKKPVVKKASEKIGRNDPCPCGSGKKYKNCCGAVNNTPTGGAK